MNNTLYCYLRIILIVAVLLVKPLHPYSSSFLHITSSIVAVIITEEEKIHTGRKKNSLFYNLGDFNMVW